MTTRALIVAVAVLGLGPTAGCSGNSDGTTDPLLEPREPAAEQSPSSGRAQNHAVSKAQNWIRARLTCGGDNTPLPSVNAVMADIPPSERAGALMNALLTEPVDGLVVGALLDLLVETGDPGTAEKIALVYSKAPELASRYRADAVERLGSPMAPPLDGTTQAIRLAAVQAAGTMKGTSAFHFLSQAAVHGEDDAVKLQAALALANRADFTDRKFLRDVGSKLSPDLGKSLDALR